MQNKIRSSLNDTVANHGPLNIYKTKAYLLWELKQGLTEMLNHGQLRDDNNIALNLSRLQRPCTMKKIDLDKS